MDQPRNRRRGASVLELSIVLSVFVVLTFGMFALNQACIIAEPIFTANPTSNGAEDYKLLAEEITRTDAN